MTTNKTTISITNWLLQLAINLSAVKIEHKEKVLTPYQVFIRLAVYHHINSTQLKLRILQISRRLNDPEFDEFVDSDMNFNFFAFRNTGYKYHRFIQELESIFPFQILPIASFTEETLQNVYPIYVEKRLYQSQKNDTNKTQY